MVRCGTCSEQLQLESAGRPNKSRRLNVGGKPRSFRTPLNPNILFKMRPDPDWAQRMGEALDGVLANTRQEWAGTIPIPDGELVIADPNGFLGILPRRATDSYAVTAHVPAGEYEVVVIVAHEGAEETHDYEEHVSHAFALLRDNKGVTTIEPLTDENGVELGVLASTVVFAGAGVMPQIAAEHPGLHVWTTSGLRRVASAEADLPWGHWARVPTRDGTGALIAVSADDRLDYPLFRLADAEGATIGVLVEFYVDNRPWEI